MIKIKKYIFLLASILIIALLCGCTAPNTAELPGEVPAETPEPTPIEAPPAFNVILPGSELPDKNYSGITPPKRFYADMMLGLVANDKYGEIYPYIGGLINVWSDSPLYGFCDKYGRIICDPIYNEVTEWIDNDGKKYYLARKYRADYVADTLISADGKELLNQIDYGNLTYIGTEPFHITYQYVPDRGNHFLKIGDNIAKENFYDVRRYGDYYTATQGNYGGLIDKDFNWLIKVSLMDYIDD